MTNEIWILGATGRTGRDIAALLHERGLPLVLVGRNRERLQALAATHASGAHSAGTRIVAGTFDQQLAAIRESAGPDAPSIVINLVGPFTRTALAVARALPEGTSYVDLSNEFAAVQDILRLGRQAAAAGQTLVAGAGFGVTAIETAVVKLCEGRPRPRAVRVDAIASLASEAGPLGEALAETIADVAAFGGGTVRGGRFVRRVRVATDFTTLTTPDGDRVATGAGPSGELLAAWQASDADDVTAGSGLVPSNPVIRAVMPLATAVFRVAPARRFATGRLAKIQFTDKPAARAHSWGHARVEWPSGETREAWLRIGDAGEFTAAACAETAARLARGEGRPGAFTPATLFGTSLAESVGAEFV